MGFKDCLVSLADAGDITREEAAFLADEFEDRFAQAKLSLGDDVAAAEARQRLIADLKADAAERRRQAHLTEAARVRLKSELQGYRNRAGEHDVYEAAMAKLSHYGYRGVSSMRGKSEAIVAMAHGKLVDVMSEFRRRGVLGKRQNMATARDMLKELRGETTGNGTAKALADSLDRVFEDLRQRFNNAGGAIPKLVNWGMPQSHDAAKIIRLADAPADRRAAWKAFITPLLDPDKMINPLTGQQVGAGGLSSALDHVFDQITTDSWAHAVPAMQKGGRGKLASQRQDPRFLVFKTADDWLTYNSRFGRGDIIQAAFDHINGMAKDIAALETFGPNPGSMVDWMVQNVRHEIAQADLGRPSYARPTSAMAGWRDGLGKPGAFAAYRIDSLYTTLRGRGTVMGGIAKTTADIRNVANSAMLGSAGVTAAFTDPFVAASARRLADLPVWKNVGEIFKAFRHQAKEDIVASGVIWDEYLHVLQDEARFVGFMTGSDWSRYLADRSMTLFGLKPVTEARQLVEARVWHRELGAQAAAHDWTDLSPRFRGALEGFGMTPSSWLVIRKSIDPDGLVTPMSVFGMTGDRDVAEQLAELTMSWRERSVPSGTPNTRSIITGKIPRGTLVGEIAEFGVQFKSFGLSYFANQIEALTQYAMRDSRGFGLGAAHYAGAMMIGMTIGGAIAQQLIGLADGKDPEDMTTPSFWGKAMMKGGGLGIFGDMLQANTNRFGQGIAGMMAGPGTALVSDTVQLPFDMAYGGDRWAKPAIDYAGRYTPILPSWWATRGAWRRLVLDQLQFLADPKAHQAFRAKEKDLSRRTGQDYFWRPGEAMPSRAPSLANVTGN